MLKQFVRDRQNRKVGVMVASATDGNVRIGLSFARPHKIASVAIVTDYREEQFEAGVDGDDFDVCRGEDIATGRMIAGTSPVVPGRYRRQVLDFVYRANRYFKDTEGCGIDCVNGLMTVNV